MNLQVFHLLQENTSIFIVLNPFFCLSSSQQALPEENYTTEHHDVFTIAGRTCIEEGNSAQVLSIVLDEKNQVRCIYLALCFRMFTCSWVFHPRPLTMHHLRL